MCKVIRQRIWPPLSRVQTVPCHARQCTVHLCNHAQRQRSIHTSMSVQAMSQQPSDARLEGRDMAVKTLLKEHLFANAVMQRHYVWTPKLVEELIFSFGLYERMQRNDREKYDLGTMVFLVEKGRAGQKPLPVQVVDGQQRLLTLLLLIAAVRQKMLKEAADCNDPTDAEIWSKRAAQLYDSLKEPENDLEDIKERLRMVVDKVHMPVLASLLLPDDSNTQQQWGGTPAARPEPTQANLQQNYKYIADQLNQLTAEEAYNLIKYTFNNAMVFASTTGDPKTAYDVFRLRSHPGQSMSVSDMFKACVMSDATDPESEQKCKELWASCEQELRLLLPPSSKSEAVDMLVVINQLLLLWLGRRLARNTEYSDPNEMYDRTGRKGLAFVKHIIRPATDAYLFALGKRGTHALHNQLSYRLLLLQRLQQLNQDWVAIVMRCCSLLQHSHLDAARMQQLQRLLQQLERFVLYALVAKLTPLRLHNRLMRCLDALCIVPGSENVRDGSATPYNPYEPQQAGLHVSEQQLVLAADILVLTNEEQAALLSAIAALRYSSRGKTHTLLKYILRRLDEFESERRKQMLHYLQPVSSVALTLEHVLPQKPSGSWLSAFPDPDERAECTHIMGNLVLIAGSRNSAASNLDFTSKKAAYMSSHQDGAASTQLLLTERVGREEVWGPQQVHRRQQELLALARDCWALTMPVDNHV